MHALTVAGCDASPDCADNDVLASIKALHEARERPPRSLLSNAETSHQRKAAGLHAQLTACRSSGRHADWNWIEGTRRFATRRKRDAASEQARGESERPLSSFRATTSRQRGRSVHEARDEHGYMQEKSAGRVATHANVGVSCQSISLPVVL